MASIDLGSLPIRRATPRFADYGGELTPPLGGPVQRINRLGNRYGISVELAPVPEEPQGRELTALLRLAKQYGAIMDWPQPGLVIGTPGTPLVNGAVISGSTVAFKGLTVGYAIRLGQFFNFIVGGRHYLHSAAAQAVANGSGHATVLLTEPLRVSLSNNGVIDMTPRIEGLLESGDLEHQQMLEPFVQIGFSIEEAE